VAPRLEGTAIAGAQHSFNQMPKIVLTGSTAISVVPLTELFEKACKNDSGGWCNEFTHLRTADIWYGGPETSAIWYKVWWTLNQRDLT
jgi:hypothetical protein